MLPLEPMIRLFQGPCRFISLAPTSVLVIMLVVVSSAGQGSRPTGTGASPALRQAISDAAKKYKIPGIAAALIEHGQLGAIEVFGVRDQKSNAPITANTIFEAGSLGEPMFAYAVLRFASEGRFNLGEPLTTYLPLPYVRDLDAISVSRATEPIYDPRFNQITAIRVMNHTSGLPDWARNQHLSMQSLPGVKWSYSNEAYLYLQHVVEHVTGEPFEDFLNRNLLGPFGMSHSSFVWRDEFAAALATGYDRSGLPVDPHRYTRPAAATTLYTSLRDYAQFVQGLLASAPSQHVHESAVSQMLGPTVAVQDSASFSWGLGVALEKTDDNVFFLHRENNPGFQSFVIASRKTGSGLVIFTNSGNGLQAVPDIVAATLGGNHPILKSNFLQSQ
jgi:CubicO group peptidase (beta-lactamase class C family)